MRNQPTEEVTSLLTAVQALHEPVTDIFHTQHSTTPNRDIARKGLILLTEVGSTLHGVSTTGNDDDIDEMGVCIEPPRTVIGLQPFEQYEYRTQPVNHRSHAGDIDRVVYGLRKYTRLAAAGNPTVLMPLFAGADKVRYQNYYGYLLKQNRHLFLTKQAGRKFLGYLDGQRSRYLDPERSDSTHASRPELIEQFGWDTKTGYHALRLAIQGAQLMSTGEILLPMSDGNRDFLLRVRNGEYSKEQVTRYLDERYIPSLNRAIEFSHLPAEPDYDQINRWLSDIYLKFWNEKRWG